MLLRSALLLALLASLGGPAAASAAPDYDGDGATDADCRPLDPNIHPGAADRPDLGITDSNCDGMDGNLATAYFVAPTGSDAAPGTKEAPFETIQMGVDAAAAAVPRRNVYIAAGSYVERVELATGVGLYGGYRPGGGRDLAETKIVAPSGSAEAVLVSGATGVVVQALSVEGADLSGLGSSSYGIRAIAGSALVLEAVQAVGGNAGDGQDRATGGTGGTGGPGVCGGFFSALFPCGAVQTGGSGGNGQGSRDGGDGADGPTTANTDGADGNPGTSGTPAPGGGGPGGCAAGPGCVRGGTDGGDGSPGLTGTSGTAGANAAFSLVNAGATWTNGSISPHAATGGGAGTAGSGGGGGGSGRSRLDTCATPSTLDGGAGGGGGGGGGGGVGGSPGGNGGGSFGLYVHQSSVVVEGGRLAGRDGGEGGNGGAGGAGGQGGGGGDGAPGEAEAAACGSVKAGDGGDGGMGGTGGVGGGGGGGAGGPSVGLFGTASSRFVTRNAELQGGTAGPGGVRGGGGSSGNAGQVGGTLAAAGANTGAADFDGDAITDPNDVCPADPSANAVDGCPSRGAVLADRDGDTVPDGDDRCPSEAAASPDGCPPSAAQPAQRISAEIRSRWRVMRGGTVARRLLVSGAPTGSTITVRCGAGAAARASLRTQFRKRCPARAKTYTVDARGTRSVVSFLNRVTKVRGRRTAVVTQLRPRTSLTVIVSAPGLIGKAVTFTMRARKRPTVIESCTPPGSAVPQATC